MASEKLPLNLIGIYQDAFNRSDIDKGFQGFDNLCFSAAIGGSVDSTGVKTIMRSVGQNPSDAEVAVWYGKHWAIVT